MRSLLAVIRRLLFPTAVILLLNRTSFAADQSPVKVGVLWAFTDAGSNTNAGAQFDAGVATFQREHGDTVAGHKIELVRRDTTGPQEEVVQRLGQELIVNDNVSLIMGLSFSPDAFTMAPISTRTKTPVFIVNSATDNVMMNAPYMVRFSYTNGQVAAALAQWAHQQGYRTMYNFYTDYVTGADVAKSFTKFYEAGGAGKIIGESKPPLHAKDFVPYLLHVRDAKPDAMFVFLGAGDYSNLFLREYQDLGLAKLGIKIIAIGSLVEDDALDALGDAAVGLVTAYNYSGAYRSPENDRFLRDFASVTGDKFRPNFAAYAVYDAMTAIYKAVQEQGGKVDPDKTMSIVKGMRFIGPRGPMVVDPQTRDLIQNIYIRRVERRGDHLVNSVIGTIPMVKNANETYQ